jgi:branched-chain amino acid transport system permease protein
MTSSPVFREIMRSFLISLWFVFLTFPLMVIKVNPIERVVHWRWGNMLYVAVTSFVLSLFFREVVRRRKLRETRPEEENRAGIALSIRRIFDEPGKRNMLTGIVFCFSLVFPFVFSSYQTTIMTTALMYVVLGLGLNIVVGMAGLLDLGYVAFYAVGAYTYALLNHHFHLGFWTVLPIGGLVAALFGFLLGFPVLRLRGDYLAIVTLGFGEIIRLILENWGKFSQGPSGIANISRPGFFGIHLSLDSAIVYMYYLMIVFVLATIFIVSRLQNSRLGRAWIALREDETACQVMGVDKRKTKLTAFALGAFWAGIIGVVFASKTTFINPASFTFLESAIILSIVVLGGMGSIIGVIMGAFILILMPEYLRPLSQYRMFAFGLILVLMMVFRPQGLIANVRSAYHFEKTKRTFHA